MTEWIPVKDEFLEADVIRWTEAIWDNKKRKGKYQRLGEVEVTAQVEEIDGEYASVTIVSATVTKNNTRRDMAPYREGETVKKKLSTLEKGEPQRLLWSDEAARSARLLEKKSEKS